MVQFDGLRPARLKVGIISAGRVGTALGVALERVDHVVVACSAVSRASRHRAERWLPDTPVSPVPDVAGREVSKCSLSIAPLHGFFGAWCVLLR